MIMTEIEETKLRIRELEDDIAEDYRAYGQLVWGETDKYFIDEVTVYSESTVSLQASIEYEVASGFGIQDGDGELEGLLAEMGAIEMLAEELYEFKASLFSTCKEVEENKRLHNGRTQ